jgi:hypothetical protein
MTMKHLALPHRFDFHRRALRIALVTAAVVSVATTASAARGTVQAGGITAISIDSVTPAFGGATFGRVGTYELVSGTAHGTIDPHVAANAGLAYLEDAPLDAQGLIDYSMDFRMLRPTDASKGNGKIFFDVINRGHDPTSFGDLNEGTLTDPGNGFLMQQGYEIVWSAWQPDADPNTVTYSADFPIASLPGSQPIVRRTMNVLIPDSTESGGRQSVAGNILTADLTYPPASLDSTADHVTLTVREDYDDPRVPLSASAVTFPSDGSIRLDLSQAVAMGFDRGAIYEVVYDAKNPWVGGVGFVSVRDLVSYLRAAPYGSVGEGGNLAGAGKPTAVIGWGVSQDGRFLRDFLWQGFNTDLSGKRVFDGVIALVAGGKKTDHNLSPDEFPFAQTSRWIRQHEDHNYPGGEFPFTYQTLTDPFTGKTDGILKKCDADATCPKIFQIDSDFETWNGHASLLVTDTMGGPLAVPPGASKRDYISAARDNGLVLPANVRVFQITGQQHGPGDGTPRPLSICKLHSDPVDGKPVFRALTVAMDRWISLGALPPASEYPNLNAGTLQTLDQAAAAWPRIPGLPFNRRIVQVRLGDYSVQPPTFGAAYPIYVPTTDRFGNPEGGVITPDLAAPLGTYMGRNFRAAGHAEDELCGGNGGFLPFASTQAQKQSGDARPSLDELYPKGAAQFRHERFLAAVALVARGLLLPSEVQSYTDEVPFPSSN